MYNYVLSSGLLLTLWDPIDATRVNKLESVQNLQLLSPGDGPTTNNSLLSHLNWPKLSTRRSRNFCYATTFLSACSMLPRSLFTPHPFQHLAQCTQPSLCFVLSHLLLNCSFFLICSQHCGYHCGIAYPWMLFVFLVFTLK